jgi:hypothetical protein
MAWIFVPKGFKPTLRRRLQTMNVGALALFPTLEGVGRSVREGVDTGMPVDDEGLLWVLEENEAKRKNLREETAKSKQVEA